MATGPTLSNSDGAHCSSAPLFALSGDQKPFYCSPGISYLFQHTSAAPEVTLAYRLDLQAGSFSVAKSGLIPGSDFTGTQAFGFNPTDNFIWGYRRKTNQLIRVGRDWSVEFVTIENLRYTTASNNNYNGADIDANGIMYLYRGGNTSSNGGAETFITRIDLNPSSPTYLQMLPTLDLNLSGVNISTDMLVIDWGLNPVDNNLYGVNNLQQLIKVNTSNGLVAKLGPTGITSTNGYGAVYFDNAGTLFISQNNGGGIYSIPNVATGNTTATFLINGPVTNQNDGARCYNSPVFTARVKGTVWNDADGDGLINGSETLLNTGTDDEDGLWANLVDASGRVVSSGPVAFDGTYTLYTGDPGTYSIVLTREEKAPGTILTEGDVSSPWLFTGTNRSNSTDVNTTDPKGVYPAIEITSVNYVLEGFNFGIQQPPTADSHTFDLVEAPYSGQQIPLNGTWPATGKNLIQLTGSDYEDGGITGETSTSTIIITTVPVATDGTAVGGVPELWYDGVLVTPGTVIENYDQNKLVVHLNGSGYKGFEFTYQVVDQAGVPSNIATYSVGWDSALPVRLKAFEVSKTSESVRLEWTTASEVNNSGFEIQRSTDNQSWTAIGFVAAQTDNTSRERNYRYHDYTATSGLTYYRLKQIDLDGTFAYSPIRSVKVDGKHEYVIYPNPTYDGLFRMMSLKGGESITVYRSSGEIAKRYKVDNLSTSFDISSLPAGLYIVEVVDAQGQASRFKLLRSN